MSKSETSSRNRWYGYDRAVHDDGGLLTVIGRPNFPSRRRRLRSPDELLAPSRTDRKWIFPLERGARSQPKIVTALSSFVFRV
jgi:hypothetical protein